jgi:hypothetical protein
MAEEQDRARKPSFSIVYWLEESQKELLSFMDRTRQNRFMLISSRTYESFIDQLPSILDSWEDQIIPSKVDLLANPRYSPRYAWMFSYERRLRDRISSVVGRKHRELERLLFGAGGVLSESLSNSFVHGHRRNPNLPIRLRCTIGSNALVLSITDSGTGFDVDAVLRRLRSRENYFHIAGNGLRSLEEEENCLASFSDEGRTLTLKVEFDGTG